MMKAMKSLAVMNIIYFPLTLINQLKKRNFIKAMMATFGHL